ncbi:MAG: alpha/beta fold hydrolase [Sandaracinus sp.]|nr:alpha/beta fold hydrolase [Sandaracinus sp.]MCB9611212.1 alpha/beta fold hydrolase [Sandaracinus sp.]MCB9630862.1 alpha/beta fold hydrolase [Sandaracinus sp.]
MAHSRWQRRLNRFRLGARNALEIARFGRLTEPYHASFHVVHQEGVFKLRRYDGRNPASALRTPILLVPPLMVTSEVYDIAPEISAVNALLRAGVDVWLCDFGSPETEEGGMARTLDDHVRAVDRAIDLVADATASDVCLAGYSQGGMFCYQAAAYRRSARVSSLVTFGSPVDIHRNLPAVGEGAAEQLIRMAELAVKLPLEKMDGLPGVLTSTGFKVLSLRKEIGQVVDFVSKLHDRQALEKRESRRRFLGGEGFVAWPGPALRKFIDEFIVHNRMISGGFVIDGRSVSLSDIQCPVLYFVGLKDDIARAPSVQAIQRAIPDGELYEVGLRAGHFGLVVGSKALTETWPTVIDWMRWREGVGTKPLRLQKHQPVPMEDPEVSDFDEIDLDLRLFVDAIGDTLGALWNRIGQLTDDAGDVVKSLKYQLPLVGQLERLEATTQISLAGSLAEQSAKNPERTFFLWRGRAFTYAEADRRVDAVSRGLSSLGVRRGDHVGVLMGARPSYLSMVAALGRLGAVAVLLPPSASDDVLRDAMKLADVKHLATDPELAARARRLSQGEVWVLGGGGPDRALDVAGVVDMEAIDPTAVVMPPGFEPNPGRAKDLSLVLFGFGKEGELRAVRITNGRWAISALGTAAACTLTPDDTVYAALPFHHPAGILVTVGGTLVGGARFALADAIEGGGFPKRLDEDPNAFWAEVRRYGATVVFYAGEMCRALVNAPFRPADKTNPVRLFAGSGMRPRVWRELAERFDVGVLEFYASSEVSAVLSNADGTKIGALGRPLPGSVEMTLVRYDFTSRSFVCDERGDVARCEANEPGVLLARLDETHPAYSETDDPRVLTRVFATNDRWWVTGDVLRRDDEGDHWYLGRVTDVIVRGGKLLFPRRAEEALDAIEGAAMAVVFSVPQEGERRLVACIVPRVSGEVSAGDVERALSRLAPLERPDAVAIVEASAIPMNEGFRPLKVELARRWNGSLRPTYVRRGDAYVRA